MRVLSTLAVKKVLDQLGPKFPLPTDQQLDISIDPTVLMVRRIKAGERGDLAILTRPESTNSAMSAFWPPKLGVTCACQKSASR